MKVLENIQEKKDWFSTSSVYWNRQYKIKEMLALTKHTIRYLFYL
jgi:hypothetical protein